MRRVKQPESVIEGARSERRLRGGQGSSCTTRRVGRQRDSAFEKGRSRSETPACLRSRRRALELIGNVLIGLRGRLGAMPGAPIRIPSRVGCCGEGAVDLAPVTRAGRPIDG